MLLLFLLTFSSQRSLSNRNLPIDLQSKSMDLLLYDRNSVMKGLMWVTFKRSFTKGFHCTRFAKYSTICIQKLQLNAKLLLRIFKRAIYHTFYVRAVCTRCIIAHLKCPYLRGWNESLKNMRTKRNMKKMEKHTPPINNMILIRKNYNMLFMFKCFVLIHII